MIIATIKSFTKPEDTYVLTRDGVRKDEGGAGVTWACTCPAHANGRGRLCKHIFVFFALVKGTPSYKYPHVTLKTHVIMAQEGADMFANNPHVVEAMRSQREEARAAKAARAKGAAKVRAALTEARATVRRRKAVA